MAENDAMTAARTPATSTAPVPPSVSAVAGTGGTAPAAVSPGNPAARDAQGPASGSGARPGLRERKKIKTRRAIRQATYRLVRAQGYEATTVEQIAEAAEVSPSTVFRYFPTKEDIVLTDECVPSSAVPGQHPRLEAELRRRPSDEPLTDSLRAVLRDTWAAAAREEPEAVRLRTRLVHEVPAVRSRLMENLSVTGRTVCRLLADRTGRAEDSLEVRVYAMGLVGALLETALYWAEHDHRDDLGDLIDRALDTFERGLTR
mgnify:CR=1 FL=1